MFKKILTTLMCLSLISCSIPSNNLDDMKDDINILTSFYPIYIIGLNLTKNAEGIALNNMAANTAGCLHDYVLTTSDMKKIEIADGFFINGAGMEGFKIPTNSKTKVFELSEGITLINSEHSHNGEDINNHDHDETATNPHYWMNIDNYIVQCSNFKNYLQELDTKNSSLYEENYNNYLKKLNELKKELEALKGKTKKVITFHEAFDYFDYGIEVVRSMVKDQNEELSSREIIELIEFANSNDVKVLISEINSDDRMDKTINNIAENTNSKVYILDPITTGEDNEDAYVNAMRKNIEVINEILK